MGKRGKRTRATASGPAPGEEDLTGDEIAFRRDPFGRTSIVPASARGLPHDQAVMLSDLQDVTMDIQALEQQQAHMAGAIRAHGVSWALVGWATGLTGEGARLKWRDDAAHHARHVDDIAAAESSE